MQIIFVIQDVKTKEYFYQYRMDEGFSANVTDATVYNNEAQALKEIDLHRDWNTELFKNKLFEIKKYIINKTS